MLGHPVQPSLASLIVALDEATRKSFVAEANWYLYLLILVTALLVAGVAIEEIADHFPIRYRLDPYSGFPRIRFRTHLWIPKVKKIGIVLAIAGIAGEGFAEYFGSRANDIVVDFDNALITGSRTEAADAEERAANAEATAKGFDSAIARSNAEAKKADARASIAVALAKGYEAQIADSNARVKTAESQVASANARAEEARSMAEGEILERRRLEAITLPRSLTVDQMRRMAEACRRFTGHKVLVSSYGLDGEAAVLGAQIISLLRVAIGNENVLDNRASFTPTGGFEFGIHVRGPDAERDLVTTLTDALRTIGQLATVANDPPLLVGGMGGGGSSFPAGTVFVTVMIGVRPVPIIQAR